jgi:hypothetical protein
LTVEAGLVKAVLPLSRTEEVRGACAR